MGDYQISEITNEEDSVTCTATVKVDTKTTQIFNNLNGPHDIQRELGKDMYTE